MAKAVLNGIDVHYQIKGEGPDVVLIHGVTSTLAIWYMKVLGALSRRFRVTIYDLRGHGYSGMTETGYTSDAMADDLLALLDHLGIDRACVVGHSFGGSIALHLAAKRPDRIAGVVLADTGIACLRRLRTIEDWPGWKTWKDELGEYGITYDWFVEAEGRDVADVIRKSFEIPQQFGIRKGAQRSTARLRKLIDETRITEEFRSVAGLTEEVLEKIQTPILAVYGETSPYQKMGTHLANVMPNYRCKLIPDTGHFYLMHKVDEFLTRIEGFLIDPRGFVGETEEHRVCDGTTDSSVEPRRGASRNGRTRNQL